jgi:hypothetical protein
MNYNPCIAEISDDSQVRQNAFLNSHNLNHVRQVICGLLDVVLDLNIVVHNLVLKS